MLAESNRKKAYSNETVRVAFYGRVSTQHEEQMYAFENQMQWYGEILEKNSNWKMVKSYSDKGITGTMTKHRAGFLEMMEDAGKGMFDLIVTREVCRFARNTVDSLEYTRKLRGMGVEVYFYNDNIWSCEPDGELRLTIFAALAQDESRKVSERAKAGQAVSRKNKVLYGNGNILGYELVKNGKPHGNTYAINEEQAETVRLIYNMYLQGMGVRKTATRLIEMKRRDASGNIKWDAAKVSRVLRNKTYAGYICYNKSRTVDFLEHKRVNNTDEADHEYIKGDFPAIIPEDIWDRVYKMRKQKTHTVQGGSVCRNASQDKWAGRLRCSCGKTFGRYKWRVNKNGEEAAGYQCRNQTHNRKKSFYEENSLSTEGYCNVPSICEWKLEFMMSEIIKRVWKSPARTAGRLLKLIEKEYESGACPGGGTQGMLKAEKEKALKRLDNLLEMRLDGSIDSITYKKIRGETETKLADIESRLEEAESAQALMDSFNEKKEKLGMVKEVLGQCTDFSSGKADSRIVREFVSEIVPYEDFTFKWYMDFCTGSSGDGSYYLYQKFTLHFDEAREYRKANGSYLRKNQWKDLKTEVYIRV